MSDITTLMMAAAGGVAEETDANFNQTVLLLHGDGTNGAQNNTFLDSSTNNFTITRNGNTTQGTFTPFSKPDGRWGNYFDGNGDYFTLANSSDFSCSGNFTVQAFAYPVSFANTPVILDTRTTSGSSTAILFYFNTSGNVVALVGGTTITSSSTYSLNTWHHIGIVRSGTTVTIYVNGSADGSNASISANLNDTGMTIGAPIDQRGATTTNKFTGYLSNISFNNATAIDFSSTGVPTAPLSTSTTNQKLLTCYGNRFADFNTATTAKTVTVNGNPKVTPFSPFAPTAAYSPSVNGGSGYFDGSSDSIVVDSALLDGSTWTVEMWVYATALGAGNKTLLSQYDLAQANRTIIDVRNGLLAIFNGTQGSNSGSTTMVTGQWYHIAFVRNSSTVTGYLNGVQEVQKTNFTGPYSIDTMIGFYPGGSAGESWSGYISNIRFSDTNKTISSVPTALLTTDGNTSALLNFTNAGIFDNTGKNNLETVGNAQIDTTTKKYGTGSMEFDGTGDWLKVPNSPDLQLGTGDFTIEFWVYLASGDTGSARGLVAKGGASTGWLVSLDSSEKVVFTYTTSTITSSGAITTNAWNHIAVVREGTGSNETKIYIGGTNDGTGTVSTDFNQTEVMYVGANRAAGDPMKGFIDDLRITKGVARYTTTFTPPTKAFPDL